MSLINMQDGVVKSSLVQMIQSRGAELARAQDGATAMQHADAARQASEYIQAMNPAEQGGIREEEERLEEDRRRRRQRRDRPDDDGEDPEQRKPTMGADGHLHVNIIA